MCLAKSRIFSRSILFFCVFALLASPLSAQASWAGLTGGNDTQDSQDSLQTSVKASPKAFSQELSTKASKTAKTDNYEELLKQLNELETAYTESQNEIENLSTWSNSLKEQLNNYAETHELSEKEYKEVVKTVNTLAEYGDSESVKVVKLANENEKLAKKTGTRPYVMLTGEYSPTAENKAGVGGAIGIRWKNGLMTQLGATTHFGSGSYNFDNWTFNAGVGWQF